MKISLSDQAGYFFIRTVMIVLSWLPERAALSTGYGLGQLVYLLSSRRRVAYADLKAVFGNKYSEKERRRIVRSHYGHMGQGVVEILRFPSLNKAAVDRNVKINNIERFHEAVDKGKGVVLLTAHFGNWEFIQIVSGVIGKPIYALARDQRHARLNQLLNEFRESHGSVAVQTGMGVRGLLRALRRKQLVGVLGDQSAGKKEGIIIPFLGRKTTLPTGAFDLAKRTGAVLLPCFMRRVKGEKHEIFVGEPLPEDGIKDYVSILENLISSYPDQWLWTKKRWKYSWTKRLVILTDGKAGHEKQADAVAAHFKTIETQYGREGMEYPTKKIRVQYRSAFHKKLFYILAPLFIPWVQGRLGWLKPFFAKETFGELLDCSADFFISAGSGLVPLNLSLARDSRGKSIVLMKPGFPYSLFRYDLAVVPAHDGGSVPSESIRTLLTPSVSEPGEIESAADKLASELRDPSRVRYSVFLGGPTRRYQMDLGSIEKTVAVMKKLSQSGADFILTTSRRTPPEISRFLKQKLSQTSACQLLVIAEEDKRSYIVNGMMGVSEVVIVTEDSISMISEAVSAGKKVVVLKCGENELPVKHRNFRDILARQSAVTLADADNLAEKIGQAEKMKAPDLVHTENEQIRKRLAEIL